MKDESYKDYIEEQLRELDDLRITHMFGGYGLYAGDDFFGIISEGKLYFKTDDTTRKPYDDAGMKPFQPSDRQTLKNYMEVPADIIDDPGQLAMWARRSIDMCVAN